MNHLKRGNMLWEGSRIILPEHREALLDLQREKQKRSRPNLDEDQLSLINHVIMASLYSKSEIVLTVYTPTDELKLIGYVVRVEQHKEKLLLQSESGDVWIDLIDVLSADFL